LRSLVLADFAPLVGKTFPVNDGPNALAALVLSDARSLGSAPSPSERSESFSLLFTSAERGHAPQAIYSLEHPELGAIEVFLVPVGPAPNGGMQYEAIFN
jgi:hypothetical protein